MIFKPFIKSKKKKDRSFSNSNSKNFIIKDHQDFYKKCDCIMCTFYFLVFCTVRCLSDQDFLGNHCVLHH